MKTTAKHQETSHLTRNQRSQELLGRLTDDLLVDLAIAMELGVLRAAAEPRVAAVFLQTGRYVEDSVRRHNSAMRVVIDVMLNGLDDPAVVATLDRVNKIHSQYSVPDEFMLYAFALLVAEPAIWLNRYGWRQMTIEEESEWSALWTRCADQLGLSNVPQQRSEWAELSNSLCRDLSCSGKHAHTLGDMARGVFEKRFIRLFRPSAGRLFEAVVDERLRRLLGYPKPSFMAAAATHTVFTLRRELLRICPPLRRRSAVKLPYMQPQSEH